MRPGVDVISLALPPPRSAPTDTGVAFIVGDTVQGPPYALVTSMTEYESTFGARTGQEATWDAADTYFHEGGFKLYVAPTNPTMTFLAAAAGPPPTAAELEAMTRAELDALAPTYGLDPAAYATKADLQAAIEGAAPAAPEAGPHVITSAQVQAALDALTKDLGPGQVLIADLTAATTPAMQSALTAHAATHNRVALLSIPDGTAAAMITAAHALNTDANSRYGACFAPSAVVPGVVAGTTRVVPYAAVEAGIISRNDVTFTANQPAAGDLGQAVWTLDLANRYTDQEYHDLNEAGANMARVIYGGVRTYGYRTVVDSTAVPEWLWFGNARLNMEITAQAEAIGEHYVFSQIDGNGHTLAQFGGDLSAMLNTFYNAGALYGATPDDAFDVIVDASVNTPATIANGEIHAVLKVKMSPGAEWVVIEIVKVATTETLAPLATPAAA